MTDDPAGALQQDWPQRAAGEPPKRHRRTFLTELPVLIVIALGLAVLIKTFLVQAFFIPSESMEPTLHGCYGCRGDRVLVNRLVYRFRDPRRGEVVVFTKPRTTADTRSLSKKVIDFLTEGFGVSQPAEPGLPLVSTNIRYRDGSIGFFNNTDLDGYINTVIGGLTWDLNKKSAISLDYQELTPHNGAVIAATKTYFLHLVANF